MNDWSLLFLLCAICSIFNLCILHHHHSTSTFPAQEKFMLLFQLNAIHAWIVRVMWVYWSLFLFHCTITRIHYLWEVVFIFWCPKIIIICDTPIGVCVRCFHIFISCFTLFVHLCLFFVLVMTLSNCPFSTCLTQVVPLFHFDSSHILSNSSSSELQQSFLLWSYLKLHSHAYTRAMVCSFVSFTYYLIYLRRQIAKKICLWWYASDVAFFCIVRFPLTVDNSDMN